MNMTASSAHDPSAGFSGCGPLLSSVEDAAKPTRLRILEAVRATGHASRAEVAKSLQISPGTVTSVTAELISAGLLEEFERPYLNSGRGRPPVALRLVSDSHHVVGMKLSDVSHSAVVCDFAGEVRAEASIPRGQSSDGTAQSLLEEAVALFDLVTEAAGLRRSDISALGLGLPGLVDYTTGHVQWSPILTEGPVPLGPDLAARLGLPVTLDNDANLVTLAELWFGAGRAKSDFAVVTIEHGVGMGLVLGNSLFRGAMGLGMELGHTKVQLDGALCRCGQRGCLEAYVADYALVREASTAMQGPLINAAEGVVLGSLYDQAKAGNEAARSIFRRAGRFLALGLANVAHLFDPNLIILSGERMRYDLLYTEEVLAEMRMMSRNTRGRPPVVEVHAWGDKVWARGAAALALTDLTETVVRMEASA
ncbi:ROK family transcriptional regulator [Alphaproteobacteria bacterium KMM 3653]|uniref:ROK family transcriptional regulator n=1 Tax=Harenicola maris TaxID=2841044 RepID=A0AAP2G6J2_9RHOB|nr:ROK family transcriptional regulator [Harenicola maris]